MDRSAGGVRPGDGRGALGMAGVAAGLAILGLGWGDGESRGALRWMVLAWMAALWAVGLGVLGRVRMRRIRFSWCLLAFAVPWPEAWVARLEALLQNGSGWVASVCLWLAGTPVYREGLVFEFPGFALEVARQCSGIHSTLVLLIVSMVAGRLLVRSGGLRVVLVASALGFGVIRNGLRIVTLAWLSLHWDAAALEGPLHKRGGPLFFAMSLVPLLALVVWMRRCEQGRRKRENAGRWGEVLS